MDVQQAKQAGRWSRSANRRFARRVFVSDLIPGRNIPDIVAFEFTVFVLDRHAAFAFDTEADFGGVVAIGLRPLAGFENREAHFDPWSEA